MSKSENVNAPVVGGTPEDVCLRCSRVPSDLIHDNPNDHGWTGTSAMHPFVDERGKLLLQWAARNVSLRGKSGQKGSRLTDDQVKWNEAIGKAERAVAEMFEPLTPDSLAEHDRYFANEYVKRAALVPRPEPRAQEPLEQEYTPEAIAELRREFEAWIAKRDVSPEVLAMVMPWKGAAVLPVSAPSLEHQDEHTEHSGRRVDRGRTLVDGTTPDDGEGDIHVYSREAPTYLCEECRHQWQASHSSYLVASSAASARSRPLEALIERSISRWREYAHAANMQQTSPQAFRLCALELETAFRVLVPGGDPQE